MHAFRGAFGKPANGGTRNSGQDKYIADADFKYKAKPTISTSRGGDTRPTPDPYKAIKGKSDKLIQDLKAASKKKKLQEAIAQTASYPKYQGVTYSDNPSGLSKKRNRTRPARPKRR